jgi:glutamate carboxypeptidase
MAPVEVLRDEIARRLPESVELLRAMVGINSWTRNPEGVARLAALTAEAFAPLGFVAESVPSIVPGYGSHIYLSRPEASGSPVSVGLVSHLDTVFPPEEEERNGFRWLREGDRAYGPGTEDIKGGTVMIWLVLQALRAAAPGVFHGTRWVIGLNAAEEELSPDFGPELVRRLSPGARAALVFEAEGRRGPVGRLVRARKGRGTFRMWAEGRSAHAGVDHARGVNAITQLARRVLQAEALTDPARLLTVNVGRIEGGGGLNRVPQSAVAEGEFRAFDPAAYASARARLLALGGTGDLRSVADGHPAEVHVRIETETSPWPVNPGTEGLLHEWISAASDLGIPLEGEERGGLSDGNHLWESVPTLDGLGPAGANAHCSERSPDGSKVPEYVELSSFAPKALLNATALVRLLRRGSSM